MNTIGQILLCVLTFLSLTTLGQTKGYINLDENGNIDNPNISIADYDVIIEPFNIKNLNIQIFEISWLDYLTDGRFFIRIVHNAIYLRQGHDNPNTNHLFWLKPMNTQQYEAIKKILNSNLPHVFLSKPQYGGT